MGFLKSPILVLPKRMALRTEYTHIKSSHGKIYANKRYISVILIFDDLLCMVGGIAAPNYFSVHESIQLVSTLGLLVVSLQSCC